MKRIAFLLIILCAGLLVSQEVQAQGQRKAIIFTGMVVAGKTSETLPRAYIYIPKAGRGTLAGSAINESGYFAIPVFPGDSVEFSYLGYKKQYHIIPRDYNAETYSAIIAMQENVQMLAEVKVYPYKNEEEFKEAFLALRAPDELERESIAKNTNMEYLNRMAARVPNNAQTNFRYTMDQQLFGRESAANKGFATTFPFLNPFAWAKLVKGIKNGDLQQKDWRKELNETPRETGSRQDFIRKDDE